MTKKLFIILIVLLASTNSYGATQQVLSTLSYGYNLNATTTQYNNVYGAGDQQDWSTTESTMKGIFAASGTLKDLRILLAADPENGAGVQSYTFKIRVNEAEPGSTLTCAISDGGTSCQDLVNSVSVTAGNYVSIQVVPANTPIVTQMKFSTTWNPTTADETILAGGTNVATLATSGTEYIGIAGTANKDTVEFDKTFVASTAGVFKNLYIGLPTAPGGVATRVFTFRDSASAESLVATCGSADTACNQTSGTVTATAGEKFVLVSTVTGTPAASIVKTSIVFVPTTSGQWIIPLSSDDNLHTTATEYAKIIGGDDAWNASATNKQITYQTGSFVADMDILNMYVELETDPGVAGDIFTFTLMQGAVASALVATCDGVTTCNATSTINISDDEQLSTRSVPTSSPTVGSAMISYTGFITPTSGGRRVILIQ